MKKTVVLTILLSIAVTSVSAVTPIRIIADKVILRLEPSFDGEVAGQVSLGQVMTSMSVKEDWFEVLPPGSISFYVHSRFVKDGVVTGTKLRVRLGPGVEYMVAHMLERGEHVDVRRMEEDWMAIAPPKGCTLWVHRKLAEEITDKPEVKPPDPPRKKNRVVVKPPKKPAVQKPSKPPAPPVVKKETAQPVKEKPAEKKEDLPGPPPALVELGLVPLPGQGRYVQYEGTLAKRGMFSGGPTKFHLESGLEEESEIVCYIAGNSKQLGKMKDSVITITGREYWLKAKEFPVVVLEHVVVMEEDGIGDSDQ